MKKQYKDPEATSRRVQILLSQNPPQAENAERGLLSCVLQSPDCLAAAQDLIPSPDAFAKPAHMFIWEAMVKIAGQGGEPDLSAIEAALSGRGVLTEVGGVDYLIDLIDGTEARPTVMLAQTRAQAVMDVYAKRLAVRFGLWATIEGFDSSDDASVMLDRIQAEAMKVGEAIGGGGSSAGPASMRELVESEPCKSSGAVLQTGLYDLDRTVKIRSGQLVVVGARPSMGKTAFLTAMADGMGREGHASAIHSLEMGRYELRDRMLSARSRVPTERLGNLIDNSIEAINLQEARGRVAMLPIDIDDSPGLTLMKLRSMTRQAVNSRGIKAVFIDYLQLLTLDKSDNREQGVAAMSRGLKMLAREFDVAVVLLSQLNRQSENREGHRPKMSDLRESGAIEQDADVVMLVHRPDYYASQKDRSHVPDGVAEIIVAKQRNGPTGVVRLHFDAECAAMVNAASSEQEALQGAVEYV